MDNHSKETRSYNMSRIQAKNTKPELLVRKFLFANGFRYRVHDKKLPGKPDIVLPKYRTVIFIHGCFWHSHKECKYSVIPKSNQDYWIPKIQGNFHRDQASELEVQRLGWKTITIWECQLKKQKIQFTLEKLMLTLRNCTSN